jgi:hypothetical protein
MLVARTLAALLVAVTPGKSPRRPYALLTLTSGHTFRVLNSGPVVDESKKRLGLAYLSSAQNTRELQADADELFEYLLPFAEEQKVEEVLVIGVITSAGKVADYEIIFDRQQSGTWSKGRLRKPFPRIPPARQLDERDAGAERAATGAASAWLSLLDEGRLEESWETAAPTLRDRVPRGAWVESGKSMRAALGNQMARKQLAIMETDKIASAPIANYMVLEYRTRFAERAAAIESVTLILCDDGKWRVAGYSVR